VTALPALMEQYVQYCIHNTNFQTLGNIDLQNVDFIYPTTLLPLGNLILQNKSVYKPPNDELVARYIDTILENPSPDGGTGTYVPIVQLSQNQEESSQSIERVYDIQRQDETLLGNAEAFTYVVGELTDNIYQHSQFARALIMGQKYHTKGYVDLSFFDNGITIPVTFEKIGLKLKPYEAIAEAINGASTIHEDRGFGLRTCTAICIKGLEGQLLAVSGSGAVYSSKDENNFYSLSNQYSLNGTLITLRIPLTAPSIDIYDYIE